MAIREGYVVDACHATSDGDGGQTAAIIEGRAADAGHAVGDGDGGQTATTIESRTADIGHKLILFYSFVTLYTILLWVWIIIH